MGLSEQQKAALAADIPRDMVKERSAGSEKVSYVTGHAMIARANEVFGPDGWQSELRGPVAEIHRGTRKSSNGGENVTILYQAQVRVTAGGTFHDDVGVGVVDTPAASLLQGIEKAQKEAITDAVKRALRHFGNSLGLALYDKSHAGIGHSTMALDMLAEVREARDVDAWIGANREWLNGKDLDDDERAAISAAAAARKKELAAGGAPAAPPPPPPPVAGAAPTPAVASAPQPVEVTPAVAAAMKRVGACRAVDEVVAVVLSTSVPDNAKRTLWNAALGRAVALDPSTTEEALRDEVAREKAATPDPKPWGVWAELNQAVWGARDLAAVEAAVAAHGAAVKALPEALRARANGLIISVRLKLRAERAATNAELEAIYGELRAAVEKARVSEGAAAWLTTILNAEAQRVAGKRAA
jgi:DNA recombination protein Rad52